MSEIFQIAVDGPSGAGKSTIAKAIARKLDIDYIDTGAMYRALGYKMLQLGITEEEPDKVAKLLADTEIDFSKGDIILDGSVINDLIRTPEIPMKASACSALGIVRKHLVKVQQEMGAKKSVIMDGRDIGTCVLPDADVKVYLTASVETRAKRRYQELQEKGEDCNLEEIAHDIEERDHRDMTREIAPLKQAEDAVLIDSSDMTIDEVVKAIVDLCK